MQHFRARDRRTAFSIWLRTGRWPRAEAARTVEVKFNPWHDPTDGRFTFAGSGRNYSGGHTISGSGSRSAPRQRQDVPKVEYVEDLTLPTVKNMEEVEVWRSSERAQHAGQLDYLKAIEVQYQRYKADLRRPLPCKLSANFPPAVAVAMAISAEASAGAAETSAVAARPVAGRMASSPAGTEASAAAAQLAAGRMAVSLAGAEAPAAAARLVAGRTARSLAEVEASAVVAQPAAGAPVNPPVVTEMASAEREPRAVGARHPKPEGRGSLSQEAVFVVLERPALGANPARAADRAVDFPAAVVASGVQVQPAAGQNPLPAPRVPRAVGDPALKPV
jgi:hypothetical protein